MNTTNFLPKPEYKDKLTEFTKEPEILKKKKTRLFDKLLDNEFLDKYFSALNKPKKKLKN